MSILDKLDTKILRDIRHLYEVTSEEATFSSIEAKIAEANELRQKV